MRWKIPGVGRGDSFCSGVARHWREQVCRAARRTSSEFTPSIRSTGIDSM
jgi:hypothetical protein